MAPPEKSKARQAKTDIFIFVLFFIFFIIACSADAHPYNTSAEYNKSDFFLAMPLLNDTPLSYEGENYLYVTSGTKIVIAYYESGSLHNGTIVLTPNYINPFNWLGVVTVSI